MTTNYSEFKVNVYNLINVCNFRYTVRLGDHDLASSDDDLIPQEIGVAKVVVHPKYDANSYKNDIAILTLEHPAELSGI